MRPLLVALPLFAALIAMPLASQQPAPAPAGAPVVLSADQAQLIMDVGKRATQYFMKSQADSLGALFEPEALERVGGVSGIAQMLAQVLERGGAPQGIVEQKLTRRRGQPQVWTEIQYTEMPSDTLVVRWIINVDGRITGAGVTPKTAAPAPDPPR